MKKFGLSLIVLFSVLLSSHNFALGGVDGGTVTTPDGSTEVYTCPGDGVADMIEATTTSTSYVPYAFIVTSDQGVVLGLPPGNTIDFENAGVGVCRIYGVSFTGYLTVSMGDNIYDLTSFSDGKSDLSDNFITVFRDEPDGGMVATPEYQTTVYTTPGDGVDDIIEVISDSEVNSKFALIVTDNYENVLGLPPGNSVNFEEAGEGICRIYGISFTGSLVIGMGDNLNDFDALSDQCSDLSDNYVTVVRQACEADGGAIEFAIGGTETVICVDGNPDPLDVNFTADASGSNIGWVITDPQLNILGMPPAPPFDLDGAGPGICLIWSIAYEDDFAGADIGVNVADLTGCFNLSNPITVTREAADGGKVKLAQGGTTFEGFAGDIVFDVAFSTNAPNLSYWFIITDNNDNILGWLDSDEGNTLDLSGAPAGECHVWGWSYSGLEDPVMGANISSLADDDCEAISENFITVTRKEACEADGGAIELAIGGTETVICVDGNPDPLDVNFTADASGSNIGWVITDPQLNILGMPPAPPFDLDGAGPGTCLIWSIAYEDDFAGADIGVNVADLTGCFNLSNPITVTREAADGGKVKLAQGGTTFEGFAGDIVFDVAFSTNAPNLSYWFIITDNNDNILGWLDSDEGNTLDLSGAPAGECHVWGWSYRGLEDPVMGANISSLADDDCEAISENFITVTRGEIDGGTVATPDGLTKVYTCPGDGNDDIIEAVANTSSMANYAIIVTDDQDNVLGLPPSNSVNLEGAGEGICRIYGVSFTGELTVKVGDNLNDLEVLSDMQSDLSDNFITAVRDEDNCNTDPSIALDGMFIGPKVKLEWTPSNFEADKYLIVRRNNRGSRRSRVIGIVSGSKTEFLDRRSNRNGDYSYWVLGLSFHPFDYVWSNRLDINQNGKGISNGRLAGIYGDDGPPSLSELQMLDHANAYPNPAQTSISVSMLHFDQEVLIRVIDLNGAEVISTTTSDLVPSLDISNLKTGIYMLMIDNGVTVVEKIRFIKN